MSNVSIAAPPKKKINPAFMVEKLEGKRDREVIYFDKDGLRQTKLEKVDAGYMVTLMKGHSVHIWTKKDLERLELNNTIPLVNDDGDVVGGVPNPISSKGE